MWCLCNGFSAKVSIYVVLVQQIRSGIEAKVSKYDTCAADLVRMSPYVVPVQRIGCMWAGMPVGANPLVGHW